MSASATLRRYRLRRLRHRLEASERRRDDLRAEARAEALFADAMRAHIEQLEAGGSHVWAGREVRL